MVQIRQYEQTQIANVSGLPVVRPAQNDQTARAISELGGAISGLAKNLDERADRNARVEAGKMIYDFEVKVTEKLQSMSDALGETNPEGFAGDFNKTFADERAAITASVTKDNPNVYLQKHLNDGFDDLQRRAFLQAMKAERDATGKYRGTQADAVISAGVKMSAMLPESFVEQAEKSDEVIDAMTGVPEAWKAERKLAGRSAMAFSAITSIMKSDSSLAVSVLENKDHAISSALKPDDYLRAKAQARTEFVTDEGRRLGDGIGLSASTLADVRSEVSKIKDDDIREFAERYAMQTYLQRKQAVDELKKKDEDAWYRAAYEKPDMSHPFPASMSPQDRLRAEDFRLSLIYQKQGGALKTDLGTYVYLYDMMTNSPQEFAKENLQKHFGGLSQSDARMFSSNQVKVQGGRTNQSAIVADQKIKEALMQMRGPAPKEKAAKERYDLQGYAFTAAVQAAVNDFEDRNKAQATPDDVQKIINDFVKHRSVEAPMPFDKYGLISGGKVMTFTQAVPGTFPEHIAAVLPDLGQVVTPESIYAFYKGLDSNRDAIEEYLSKKGIPATDQNIVDVYAARLRAK